MVPDILNFGLVAGKAWGKAMSRGASSIGKKTKEKVSKVG